MAAKGDLGRQRLYVYNGGFLTQPVVRRILELEGFDISLGAPGPEDAVGVWGMSPTSPRGEAVARAKAAPIIRVEDAFLRSVLPGRDGGGPPLGLLVDRRGVHFDPSKPSDLEHLLATHPLDDTALLDRARRAISWMRDKSISKYNAFDPGDQGLEAPYVLVIDQTKGDASVTASGATPSTFAEMVVLAQEEHPRSKIIIKSHPETIGGHREGHLGADISSDNVSLLTDAVDPWALLEGALAVYTVSSQMGFEAILAGHKPQVFGQPFYAGWGLTEDRAPANATTSRRQRNLTRAQLFAAAMILYPTWYDPYRDRLASLEDTLAALEAQARAWREDRHGWVAAGMRAWKRKPLQQVFGQQRAVQFSDKPKPKPTMVWASKAATLPHAQVRVEDGFLRSKGLGADLIPPLSLVLDDLGIYYDPSKPSRLDQWIATRAKLTDAQEARALALRQAILAAGLSKYNLGKTPPPLPQGHRILIPGQVEDDASILLGTGRVASNLDLIKAARAENPDARLLYKPHPDVEAGLRPGALGDAVLNDLEVTVLTDVDPARLLDEVQEVWTMTSLLGFEALLRGVPVTCLGSPFYAGWGLTTDAGPRVLHRSARVSLSGLIHASLIDYPRYFDPKTNKACPVEVVVDRLARSDLPAPGKTNRALAKLQGWFAAYAYLWRR